MSGPNDAVTGSGANPAADASRTYQYVTHWRLDAPPEAVWKALTEVDDWPRWWPYVRSVELLRRGREPDGVGALRRIAWGSRLPYGFTLDVECVESEAPRRLRGRSSGALEGEGLWELWADGPVSCPSNTPHWTDRDGDDRESASRADTLRIGSAWRRCERPISARPEGVRPDGALARPAIRADTLSICPVARTHDHHHLVESQCGVLLGEDTRTVVRYTWRLDLNTMWMRLMAPLMSPVFRWNHEGVMRGGGQGLARWLAAKCSSPLSE